MGIAERIANFNGWALDSIESQHVIGVHKIFFECLADQTKAEKGNSFIPTLFDRHSTQYFYRFIF